MKPWVMSSLRENAKHEKRMRHRPDHHQQLMMKMNLKQNLISMIRERKKEKLI